MPQNSRDLISQEMRARLSQRGLLFARPLLRLLDHQQVQLAAILDPRVEAQRVLV